MGAQLLCRVPTRDVVGRVGVDGQIVRRGVPDVAERHPDRDVLTDLEEALLVVERIDGDVDALPARARQPEVHQPRRELGEARPVRLARHGTVHAQLARGRVLQDERAAGVVVRGFAERAGADRLVARLLRHRRTRGPGLAQAQSVLRSRGAPSSSRPSRRS